MHKCVTAQNITKFRKENNMFMKKKRIKPGGAVFREKFCVCHLLTCGISYIVAVHKEFCSCPRLKLRQFQIRVQGDAHACYWALLDGIVLLHAFCYICLCAMRPFRCLSICCRVYGKLMGRGLFAFILIGQSKASSE